MAIINGVGRVGIRNYVPINNPLWNNLLAYYTGDDTPNDAKGIYNGTLVNGATYSTGKINNGFSFDGVNDYVNLGNVLNLDGATPFTVSAWVYTSSTLAQTYFSKSDGSTYQGYELSVNLGTGVRFNLRSASGSLDLTINGQKENEWQHIVFTYDGSKNASGVNGYINGVLMTKNVTSNSLSGLVSTTVNAQIGARWGTSQPFNGRIDELGLWNRALTATEVTELYNAGSGKQYIPPTPLWVGLAAYYTGDDTSNDSTGTYNGTLVNGATYGTGKIGSALSFDGINDYMSTSTNSPINSSLPHTYSCWVKASSNSGTKILMGNGTSMIGFRGGNNLTFFQYYVNAESNSNYSLAINTWYHISVVYKGTSFGANNVLFYVNGSLVYTGSLSMPSGVGKIYLGSNNAGSGGFYGGLIDEAGAWNRALTSSEVTELYNAGAGKQYINQ